MIVQSPWERLLTAEPALKLVPERSTEIAHFYWCTEIKTTEIWEAYGLNIVGLQSLQATGAAVFVKQDCKRCNKWIYATSRNDAIERVKRWQSGETYRFAKWADPSLCRECKDEVYREEHGARGDAFRREQSARAERIRELRFMPYGEYLRTPEWQQTRQGALKRARFMCQTCSSSGELHVHHRTYARRGAEYNSDLIVLCADCHEAFHERRQLAEGGRAS